MPSPLSSLKREKISALFELKTPYKEIAKLVSCSEATVKRYAIKKKLWGSVDPLTVGKKGRPAILTHVMIEVSIPCFTECVFINRRCTSH